MSTEIPLLLLEQMPIGILWRSIDRDGRASRVNANQAACRLLELSESHLSLSELAMLPFHLDEQLTPLSDLPPLQPNPLKQALQGESVNRRDILFGQRPLHIKSMRLNLPQTDTNGGAEGVHECFAVFIQPRDHRLFVDNANTPSLSNIELSVRDLLAFDKLLSELSSRFIHAQPCQMNLHIDAALQAVGQFCLADRCYVFQFDATLDCMHNTHEWVADGISSHIDDLQNVTADQLPWFFQTIQRQGLMVVHDTADLPKAAAAEQALFTDEGIHSVMCVGITLGGKLSGFVGCDMVAQSKQWTEADIRRLKLVGEIIGQGLQSQHHLIALANTQQELMQANQKLQQLADEDGLTGLANRRQFDRQFEAEIRRALRLDHGLCVMMIDIDHFKAYNDVFGHIQGDAALLQVSQLLHDHFKRSGELVARYGGEEFAVVLPGADYNEAVASGGHLLERMEHLAIRHPNAPQKLLSLSVGVASLQDHMVKSRLHQFEPQAIIGSLLEQADQALYRAKASGRNCVVGAC
ncbi:MAG: sensor domain-containing diguanylate cyclase [Idiomarina sp.]|nr:sensor domain-containing diguanylate cyclase [Idiomarina sp.]